MPLDLILSVQIDSIPIKETDFFAARKSYDPLHASRYGVSSLGDVETVNLRVTASGKMTKP